MDLTEKSALELHTSFMKGELSAENIVQAYLEKIDMIDPQVKAFLRTYPDKAMEKAAHIDAKRKSNKPLGKLAGVPIAIKDNIHVEGDLTTCASKFLENYKAPFSATATRLLEMEDAIFVGKTNMDEFAMGSSTEHSAFFPTKNPWNLSCTPGGSSGGSAAAVAARMTPFALGTDTGGSIRQPASFCGVVGYKPTYGRVSRYGLVAFGSSLDQIGPFSNSVKDSAMIMEVLGQHCLHDATSIQKGAEVYLPKLSESVADLKVGVPRSFLKNLNPSTAENFNQCLKTLENLGAKIVDIDLSILEHSVSVYYILATAEASTNLARFDGVRYGKRANCSNLKELYFNSREEGFGKEVKQRILLGTYVLSAGYQDAYYRKAQKVRTLMIRAFNTAFESCNCIAMPCVPTSAFPLGAIQDPLEMYLQDIFTIGANLGGVPAISVPSGFDPQNKPLGLQMIAPQQHDVLLHAYAYAFEQAHKAPVKMPPILAQKETSK